MANMAKIKQLTDVENLENIYPVSVAQAIFRQDKNITVEQSLKDLESAGVEGPEGKSAYQVAVKNGFKGTEKEWLASLKGAKGENGSQGIQGPSGTISNITASVNKTIGTPSVKVSLGGTPQNRTFDLAFTNLKGEKGEAGSQGIRGEKGLTGDTGNGISRIEKVTANTGSGESNTIRVTYTNGGHNDFTINNGAQGATGPQGPGGSKGDTGTAAGFGKPTAKITGGTGTPSVKVTTSGANTSKIFNFEFNNIKGEKGETGGIGPQGPAGKDGQKGETGSTGLQGPRGEAGERGLTGAQGPKGDPGMGFKIFKIYKSVAQMNEDYKNTSSIPIGGFVLVDTGNTADSEHGRLYVKTESKFDFIIDMSGAKGIQGPRGEKGLTGEQGPEGKVGPAGPQGLQGKEGPAGKNGSNGVSIASVKQTVTATSDDGDNIITVTLSDGKTSTFKVQNGSKGSTGERGPVGGIGPTGNGISGIEKITNETGSGKANTIRVTYTNKNYNDFTVYNGAQGATGGKGDPGVAAGFGIPTAKVTNNAVGTPSVKITSSGPNTAKIFDFAFTNLKGQKGDTPKKGTDYFTTEDINQVSTEAAKKVSKVSLGLDKVNNTADNEKRVSYAETAGSAKASDVSAWAKAGTKPEYNWTEIKNKPSTLIDPNDVFILDGGIGASW